VPTGYLYSTLLYYGDRPPPQPLKDWFSGYNARQTIEAGIKEGKGVFRLRHPLVRSPFGMLIQEQFSLFAANFVRWAAQWARQLVRQANHAVQEALHEVKTLVQDVAHCRARLVHNALGRVLIFDEHSPYAGAQYRKSHYGPLTAGRAFQRFTSCFSCACDCCGERV
jgi:hypothetical protein